VGGHKLYIFPPNSRSTAPLRRLFRLFPLTPYFYRLSAGAVFRVASRETACLSSLLRCESFSSSLFFSFSRHLCSSTSSRARCSSSSVSTCLHHGMYNAHMFLIIHVHVLTPWDDEMDICFTCFLSVRICPRTLCGDSD